MPEPEKEHDQDARDPAEEVCVDHGEGANREEHGVAQAAHDRQEQREGQDQHLGDQKDLDVQHERAGDLREVVREDPEVEEGPLKRTSPSS